MNKRWLRFAISALVAIGLIPGAAADDCYRAFDVQLGIDQVHVTLVVTTWGAQAAEARHVIDQVHGNGNGRVGVDEIAAYEDHSRLEGPHALEGCERHPSVVRIDGQRASWLESVAVDVALDSALRGARDDLVVRYGVVLGFDGTGDGGWPRERAFAQVDVHQLSDLHFMIECALPEGTHLDWHAAPCMTEVQQPDRRLQVVSVAGAPTHSIGLDPEVLDAFAAHADADGLKLPPELAWQHLHHPTALHVEVTRTAWSAWALLGGAGLALVIAGERSTGKRLWPALRPYASGLFLFSRFARGNALEHPMRDQIMHAVQANPGLTLSELMDACRVPRGTLSHHVRLLTQLGHLRVARAGGRSRVFPVGPRIEPTALLPPVRGRVLALLKERGRATRAELAEILGVHPKTIAYHCERLVQDGLARTVAGGMARTYEPADANASSDAEPTAERKSNARGHGSV